MKLSKKILAGVLGVAMVAMTSVSALAVAPGYSDYGASDEKDVVAGETLELTTTAKTGVTVEVAADVLPEGVKKVKMEVAAVDNAKVADAIATAEKDGFKNVAVLDIVLKDQDGNPIEKLNGKVTVSVPAAGNQNAVLYIADDNKVSDMGAKLSNGYLSFETDHFSYYAAAEKVNGAVDGGSDNVQTGENNNVTIAVVAVMFIAAAGIVVMSVKAKKVRAK